VTISDTVSNNIEATRVIPEGVTISDTVTGADETLLVPIVAEALSERELFSRKFKLTIKCSGYVDLTPALLSLQGRLGSLGSTWVSCVIPDTSVLSAIASRYNSGTIDLIFHYQYYRNGILELEKEFARVQIDKDTDVGSYRLDEGANNRSITLEGLNNKPYTSSRTIIINEESIEKKITHDDGSFVVTICEFNPYLRPGCAVQQGATDYTAVSISYSLSVDSQQTSINTGTKI
jgi:hypothetical protein